MFSTKIFLAMI